MNVSMLRQSLPLLFALLPVAAYAQSPSPVLIQSGAQIQLPVPANADKPRLQITLAGSNSVLDDERANIQNGVATARLEADPGTYDVRVVSSDKARTPLGVSRRFQIPGFKREAGRWLFNGSAVAYQGTNPPALNSFLPNLKRSVKTKLPVSVATTAPIKWDVASLGVEFPDTVATSTFPINLTDIAGERAKFQAQQAALNAANPKGALLLSEPFVGYKARSYQQARIETLSPLVDGIIIDCDSPAYATNTYQVAFPNPLLKIARRNVEESLNFDLPVFARFATPESDPAMLRAFQDGASGIIVPEGTTSPFLDVLARQSARFAGAVTIEDVGLQAEDFDRFAPLLRYAGRIPLLARLPGDGNSPDKDNNKNAESLFVAFDSSTTAATLDKIESASRLGVTIYCEGTLPSALLSKWGTITRTTLTALPESRVSTVTLSEPWFWGTLNDQNFDALQTLTITVNPSVAAQTKDVKGEARETVARPLARFNGDPNAIMLCPVGKGRVIWAPFDVSRPTTEAGQNPTAFTKEIDQLIPTELATSYYGRPKLNMDVSYYAAIAGAMQASLVSYQAPPLASSNISVALRALPADPTNPKSSSVSLVAFFNSSNAPIDIDAQVRGDGTFALDLMIDQPVTTTIRDFATRMKLQIPANGFRWVAIAKDAQAWNDAAKKGVRAQLK